MLAEIASFRDGVKAYQTEPLSPHAVGSSAAAVAPVVSTLSVNGRALIIVALAKSSFAGGPWANAGPAGRTTARPNRTTSARRVILAIMMVLLYSSSQECRVAFLVESASEVGTGAQVSPPRDR